MTCSLTLAALLGLLSSEAFAATPASGGTKTPAPAAAADDGGTNIFACGSSGKDECMDRDGDGWFANDPEAAQTDCDDSKKSAFRGAPLIIGDGVNNACVNGADDVSERAELIAKVGGPTSKKGAALELAIGRCVDSYANSYSEGGPLLWDSGRKSGRECQAASEISDITNLGRNTMGNGADLWNFQMASKASADAADAKEKVEALERNLKDTLSAAQRATEQSVKDLLEKQAKDLKAELDKIAATQATQKATLERVDGDNAKQNTRLDRLDKYGPAFSVFVQVGAGGQSAINADICTGFNSDLECEGTEDMRIRAPGLASIGGGVWTGFFAPAAGWRNDEAFGHLFVVQGSISLTSDKGENAEGDEKRYGGMTVGGNIGWLWAINQEESFLLGPVVGFENHATGTTPIAARVTANYATVGVAGLWNPLIPGYGAAGIRSTLEGGIGRHGTDVKYGDFYSQRIVGPEFVVTFKVAAFGGEGPPAR